MPVSGRYITQADTEDRLSAEAVQRICDDTAGGVPTPTVLQRYINDAESFFEGKVKAVYPLTTLRALGIAAPNEVKRICLDVLTAFLYQRHPAFIRGGWDILLANARADIKELRLAEAELDTTLPPEPAANTGGNTESGDPLDTTPQELVFNGVGRMGDF